MVWYFRRLIFHLPCKLPGDRNSCLPQLRLNLHDRPTAENTRCVRSGLVCTGGLCSVEIWPCQCKELCAIDFWQNALELVILLRLVALHSGISTDEFQVLCYRVSLAVQLPSYIPLYLVPYTAMKVPTYFWPSAAAYWEMRSSSTL